MIDESIPRKGISIWQPWATLIALGHKRYETRTWRAWHRGPVAIHAAKKVVSLDELVTLDPAWQIPRPLATPRGVVVAIADLAAVYAAEDVVHELDDKERALGDFGPCRSVWRLDNVRELPEPVPCRGDQGFFTLPAEVREAIAAQNLRPVSH